MTTSTASTASTAPSPLLSALRRIYLLRFAFAIVWAALLIPNGDETGPLLTVLLVVYPLVDAAAVLQQLRSERGTGGQRPAEWANVAVSLVVAAALGWASTDSLSAALAVWGAWAIGSGLTQLVTAVLRRRAGGQVPQILSGGISVLAGVAFLAQSSGHPSSISGIGGYAILGGVFFLISALRLRSLTRGAARI